MIRVYQRSFGGGEVTPEFWGRIDDVKYQTGLTTCRNFLVKPQGPIENRPGTVFVREVKNSAKATRLISFTYSTTQTMVIELGHEYMRFHTSAATLLYSTPAAWLTATAYVIGDIRSNGGTNYYCLAAHTSGTFATDLAASRWYAMPTNPNIYEIPTPYQEADLFDIHYVQSADVLTLVHTGYAPRELRRYGATNWQLSTISFASSLSAPTGVSATASGGTGTTYYYVVTAVGSLATDESVQSSAASVSGNLLASAAYNTITWSSVSGAQRYYVYKLSGGLYGYIGQADSSLSFRDDNIAADMSRTPPIAQTVFNSSTNYPGAVSYFEQRRIFAGTITQPQNVWMTMSGTESNMNYSLPIRDDDSIQFRIAAREANTVRHVVPLTNLLLLTSGAEWKVDGSPLTPSSVSVIPQSYIGVSMVAPVIIANNIIYAAARGGHVREMAYAFSANGYISGDLSLRAPHLFDGYEIEDMAYGKAPYPIVWCISSTGRLLGFTYLPEQQIGSWHRHDTDGSFESVAVVAEGSVDVPYFIVKRTINGSTKRYVECLADRAFADPEDAFFVDSGATYSGLVAQTLTIGTGYGTAGSTGVTFTAGAAAFNSGMVGEYIRYRYEETDDRGLGTGTYINALAKITGYTSTTIVTATIITAFPSNSLAASAWSVTADTISGLSHLEGETVSILGDGAVMPQAVVTSGSITLSRSVSKAQIGLPIISDMETLPIAFEAPDFGSGRVKNVNQVWVRVYRSGGIFVGPDFDNLVEAKQRTTEPWGSPPDLKTEAIRIVLNSSWGSTGQVCLRQSDPLPLTVVAMTIEAAIGGG